MSTKEDRGRGQLHSRSQRSWRDETNPSGTTEPADPAAIPDSTLDLGRGGEDEVAASLGPSFKGTCTTCHDTPNSGNHSVSAPLNIGLTDASKRTSDLPLSTLRNKPTGDEITTSDPGHAQISGKWNAGGK